MGGLADGVAGFMADIQEIRRLIVQKFMEYFILISIHGSIAYLLLTF